MSLSYDTGFTATGTTSCTVTVTTIPRGRVLWAIVVADAGTITAPSGWTSRGSANTPIGGFPCAVFSRVSDGDVPPTHTFSGGTGVTEAIILAIDNVDITTENDAAVTFNTGSAATVTFPNITSVTANTLHIVAVADNPGATTLPGGAYTARQASATFIKSASAPIAAIGLVTGVAGGGGADWVAISILARPKGPTITSQPTNQEAAVGATATFTVAATANDGALSYQWKDDGSNVGTNSNSYTTGTLALSDQWAQITCVVSDADGSVTSNAATLRVTFAGAGTGPRRRQIIGGFPIGSWGPLGVFVTAGGTVVNPLTGRISQIVRMAA